MKPVLFHPEAEEELDAAVARYESQRQGVGLEFMEEVKIAVQVSCPTANLTGVLPLLWSWLLKKNLVDDQSHLDNGKNKDGNGEQEKSSVEGMNG